MAIVFTLRDKRKGDEQGIENVMLHITSEIEDCEHKTYISMTAKIGGEIFQFDFDELSTYETGQLIHFLRYKDCSEISE